MTKLTDFSWNGFLGKLTPSTVSRLGDKWNISAWSEIDAAMKKANRQDIKAWSDAVNQLEKTEEVARVVENADKIKTMGCAIGRELLIDYCDSQWIDNNADNTDLELAALAYLERTEAFNDAERWTNVELIENWEVFKAANPVSFELDASVISDFELAIEQHWQSERFKGKCAITAVCKDGEYVLELGYEQEPESVTQFVKHEESRKTDIVITRPVREGFIYYDSTTGMLKVKIYRGNPRKYSNIVRLFSECCFDDADIFPTDEKRTARYNLQKFVKRPDFLTDIVDSQLEKIVVTSLAITSPFIQSGIIEARIPAKAASRSGRDVYDVLGAHNSWDGCQVLSVGLKAYFYEGRRRILNLDLKSKGCAMSAGDPRYEIIEDHLRRWKVINE